jgi:hypothetical protein
MRDGALAGRVLVSVARDVIRPMTGSTLSDRVDTFLARLSHEDRLALAEKLAENQSDAGVRTAIRMQAEIGSYYHGTGEALVKYLKTTGLDEPAAWRRSDELIQASSLAYLTTFHPTLLAAVWSDFLTGLGKSVSV